MNSGLLRHRATLDLPASDGVTPLVPPDWWCGMVGTAGEGTLLLVGRFHPGITTATRVHLKGRTYHVDAILNLEERDVELQLTCHEVFDT